MLECTDETVMEWNDGTVLEWSDGTECWGRMLE